MDTERAESYLVPFGILLMLAGGLLWWLDFECPPGMGCYAPRAPQWAVIIGAGWTMIWIAFGLWLGRSERWSLRRSFRHLRTGIR